MNRETIRKLTEISGKITELKDELEIIIQDEQIAFDTLTDEQGDEDWEQMQDDLCFLSYAYDDLENAAFQIDNITEDERNEKR